MNSATGQKLGGEELRKAVQAAGPMVKDVRRHLSQLSVCPMTAK